VIIVIDKRIVPSIRRVNDRLRDGGLEARQSACMMKSAVLPSSPYEHFIPA
jgi:hypothetical protein